MSLELPFDLPDYFIASIGCPSPNQYVAIFWNGEDEVLYNDGNKQSELDDLWAVNDFFEQVGIETWFLDRLEINLGRQSTATHWLVVDTTLNEAIIAILEVAQKIVNAQEINDG